MVYKHIPFFNCSTLIFTHIYIFLKDFVFVKAKKSLAVLLEDQEPLYLAVDDVSVLQYSAVQEYVLADELILI